MSGPLDAIKAQERESACYSRVGAAELVVSSIFSGSRKAGDPRGKDAEFVEPGVDASSSCKPAAGGGHFYSKVIFVRMIDILRPGVIPLLSAYLYSRHNDPVDRGRARRHFADQELAARAPVQPGFAATMRLCYRTGPSRHRFSSPKVYTGARPRTIKLTQFVQRFQSVP
jgi:hypothetical protein